MNTEQKIAVTVALLMGLISTVAWFVVLGWWFLLVGVTTGIILALYARYEPRIYTSYNFSLVAQSTMFFVLGSFFGPIIPVLVLSAMNIMIGYTSLTLAKRVNLPIIWGN